MRGDLYNALGRYRDAIDDYDQSISLKPDNRRGIPWPRLLLGPTGRLSVAPSRTSTSCSRCSPNDAKALTLRGAAKFRLSDNEGAVADFTAAMKITPQEVYLYLARSAALVKLDRHAEALQDREEAVKLAPNSAEVSIWRGAAPTTNWASTRKAWPIAARRSNWIPSFPRLGSRVAAPIICWETTPRRSPTWRRHWACGRIIKRLRRSWPRPKSASRILSRVRKVSKARKPSRLKPRISRHRLHRRRPHPPSLSPQRRPLQRPSQYLPQCPPQFPLQPQRPPASRVSSSVPPIATASTTGTAQQHEARGRAFTQSEKFPEALAELSQAIQLDPNAAHAYNARGYVYLRQHDYQHALADFNDAIRLNPKYANAYQNRAATRKALGDAEGAAADLKASRLAADPAPPGTQR